VTGFVLWFTGLSGSGKSTLAALVAAELRVRRVHVETLDGDEVRKNLSKGLGFSKEDRDANVRRLGFVARLIARSGGCAITAAISPYRDVRDEVRSGIARFCEVHCDCPVEVLTKRDPKGLYAKAIRGEIKNFTGIDDPYEAPLAPEVRINTDGTEDPTVSAQRILDKLSELGFLRPGAGAAQDGAPAAARLEELA
jgi:adenylyl-sulfate kinase